MRWSSMSWVIYFLSNRSLIFYHTHVVLGVIIKMGLNALCCTFLNWRAMYPSYNLFPCRISFNVSTLSSCWNCIFRKRICYNKRLGWTLIAVCYCILFEAIYWPRSLHLMRHLCLILRVFLFLAWVHYWWDSWFLRYITPTWCIILIGKAAKLL